jgi:hypothetical protein
MRIIRRFHSYASRIGSKKTPSSRGGFEQPRGKSFPFIRFTNWKQVGKECWVIDSLVFPFIRFTNWKQAHNRVQCVQIRTRFHSYASRIGSKYVRLYNAAPSPTFPFIRFTNWKQVPHRLLFSQEMPSSVSIHTLHELEASFRFFYLFLRDISRYVSIHTLHELEASTSP